MSKKQIQKDNVSSTLEKYGIEALAFTMPSSISKESRLILSIQTISGTCSVISIPRSSIDVPQKLIKVLLDAGLDHQDKNDWKEIQKLLKVTPKQSYKIVARPGFWKDMYLNGNNKIIGKIVGTKPFLDPDANVLPSSVSKKGTLKEWQENVAYLGKHSPLIMLSLCAAFSSYIVRWSGVETGGFHLCGTSSTGKSTCLYTAVSVHGSREGLNYWATTSTAIEETAVAYCDLLLCLDELKLLHEDSVKAAQLASTIVYKLASGQAKNRAASYQCKSKQRAQKWRTTILSSGELSLAEHAKGSGPGRMLGEEVRVPDVPADAGVGMGIFETLPEGIKFSTELVESINLLTTKYYGTAHHQFLVKLTKHLSDDKELVRRRIAQQMSIFMNKNNVSQTNGSEARLAKRFALAYAAGIFAIKYKVLDFSKAEVLYAITKCYKDSLKARAPSQAELIDNACIKVNKLLAGSDCIDIRDKQIGISDKKIQQAQGYITIVDNQVVRAIPTKIIEDLVAGDKVIFKGVIDWFRDGKRLSKKLDNKNTRQIKLPTKGGCTKRCICFLGAQ